MKYKVAMFGQRLREIRKKKGMTLEAVADRYNEIVRGPSKMRATYINGIELGRRSDIKLTTACAISEALETPIDDFIAK